MDYFQNDQFAEGLVSVQRATIECIKENVPATWNTVSTVGTTPEEKVENSADTTSNTEKVEEAQNGKSLAKAIWSALVGFIVAFAIYTIAECKKAKKKAKEFYKKEVEIIEEKVEKNSKKAEEQFKKEKSEMRLQHELEMDDLRTSTTNEIFQKDEELKKMKEKFVDLTVKYEALSDRYERAMKFYKGLNPAAVTFFDVMLYEKLKKMLRKANDDHNEQEARRRREREEEERRRRNSYHSSSYHHHSGGSFGGHGGISHGGGANRHF